MKGLTYIPSEFQFVTAYSALQAARKALTINDLALYSQWTRFDPRLGEQLVTHFAKYWLRINPMALHQELGQMPWPQAMGVILEHVEEFTDFSEEKIRKAFGDWYRCAMTGFEPAHDEQFFNGLRSLGGREMLDDAKFSLSLYRRWGYLSRELLLNKAVNRNKTLVPAESRRVALDELAEGGKRFSLSEYLEKLRGNVSRRQAERDLSRHGGLKAVGRTKARYYMRVKRG